VTQKFNNSAVDNRILKADVETLRAKVNPCFNYFTSKTGYRSLLLGSRFSAI